MKKYFSSLTALSLCLFGLTSCGASVSRMADSGINYAESTETITSNPERGKANTFWVVCRKDGVTPVSSPRGYTTVMYDLGCFSAGNQYKGVVPDGMGGEDIPINEQTLGAIAQTLDFARNSGATITLRFAYTNGSKCGSEPAEFAMILTHIRQLTEVLNQYADIILSVECGMVGPWGEMHSSNYIGRKHIVPIMQTWLESLDESITLQVRNPGCLLFYTGKSPSDLIDSLPLENIPELKRVGMYNDGYLGTDIDYGTFPGGSGSLTRKQGIEFLAAQTNVPYGGEIAHVKRDFAEKNSILYKDGYNIVEEYYKSHLTYLRNICNNGHVLSDCMEFEITHEYDFEGMPDISAYYGLNMQKFVLDHMGYRFVLRDSKLSETVSPGGTLHLTGAIENTGFANIQKEKTTEILLCRDDVCYECTVDIDFRNFASCAVGTYDITLDIPKSAKSGTYDVFMRVRTPSENADEKLFRTVRFANDNTWNTEHGANYLGQIAVSGRAVSKNDVFRQTETKSE